MLISYKRGQGSIVLRVKIPNTSATDNSGVTGLTFSSTGLNISIAADNEVSPTAYTSAGSTIETITTLGTYAAPTATKCRFKEYNSTNHPGIYEIQIADARFAVTSCKSALITIKAITALSVAQVDVLIPLLDADPYIPNAIRTATAQNGGGNNGIKLDSGAGSTTDIYKGLMVFLTSGTGVGQVRTIIGYNGSSKIATIDRPWTISPDTTSIFTLLPTEAPALNTNLQVTTNVPSTIIRSGTAQAGASRTITLDSGASTSTNIYNGNIVTIIGGTGIGQSRTIIAYNGTTKVATVDRAWNVIPDNTSTFNIFASTAPSPFSDQGVAQAATTNTITLQSTASATNSIYNGSILNILSGTDSGDTVQITAYDGTTKVATVSPNFAVTPDSTSSYVIIPAVESSAPVTPPSVAEITSAIFSQLILDPITGGVLLGEMMPDGVTGMAHGGTPGSSIATFAMAQMRLKSISGAALNIESVSGVAAQIISDDGTAIYIEGDTGGNAGRGIDIYSDEIGVRIQSDIAVEIFGGAGLGNNGIALWLDTDSIDDTIILIGGGGNSNNTHGITITPRGTDKHGLKIAGGNTSGDAIHLTTTNGYGIYGTLGPTALDAIPMTAPTTPASNFREMMVQIWRRFFKKSIKDVDALTIKTYADDGTTVITTQTFTDDGQGNEALEAST